MNSRIGRKLLLAIIICIVLTVSVCSVVTVSRSASHINTLMLNMSNSGLNILINGMTSQVDRLEDIYNVIDSSGVYASEMAPERNALWSEHKGSDEDFAAMCSADGNIYWSTDNFKLADFSPTKVGDSGYKGVVVDSKAGLTIQHAMPIIIAGVPVGAVVIGMHLNENTWLDQIKTQSNSDVTIFSGTTRYATTILNESGERVVGTEMSPNVAEVVINQGQSYVGTAVILGQNYFVHYEPLKDIEGNVVGAYFSGLSSEESDQLKASLILIATIVCIIVAGISLVIISWVSVKMIINPIKEVEKLAESMSKGELHIPDSTYKFSNNELGDFARRLEQTKHSLSEYILDIKQVLASMAKGDFTASPNVEYAGDFSEISDSFIGIQKALKEIIGNISVSSDSVMNQSMQISGGSQAVADGTARQASAINQLSASVNDIADEVQQSANNADEARKISALSEEKIKEQSHDMEEMLSAMEEIKEKSDKIQNIMKAINDIASQTNILAINAAIEAARAGEAGKGFAVVAGEVGNLAAKSGESAKQTGELITATIEAVEKGTVIAKNTASSMEEVNELSNRTNDYIVEISRAAADQAQAISQVKIGIEEISNVIQQNSATAEQTAASSAILSNQSSLLQEQIGKLKV